MQFACTAKLESHFAATWPEAPAALVEVDLCPTEFEGDVTLNCFTLARQLRRPPAAIAAAAETFLASHPDVVRCERIKAFVNVTLQPACLFRDTVADEQALLAAAQLPAPARQRILIEFSAPNTNKPQHLGHVRNNAIGMAMVAILRAAGHTVIPVNLVNDRGIHICKSMLAYQRWGAGETPESSGRKGDHLVGDYYVRFDRELQAQLAALRAAQPALEERSDEDLFAETEIGGGAQEMLRRWEQDDPETRALWATMNGWVLDGFAATYARMGVEFERTYLESDTYTHGKAIVEKGLADGVFQRREDGAVFIDLSAEKLGQKVVLRADGTSVYVTQDIGTSLLKQEDYAPETQVWVVGDEQIHHFRVLFAILRALGFAWAGELRHMAYGMVNLPSGRMKSREGVVVDADDLFAELEELARAATLERSDTVADDDLQQRASVISMAALKFMLLKVNPRTTLLFDPQASLKFEGDTGPYVLYACARISSMLRKAAGETMTGTVLWSELGTNEERELALRCALYGETIRRAAADFDTSRLANYLLDLAKAFSRFYQLCPVLTAPSPALRRARMALSLRARNVLRAGLHALTIETLDSM